MSFSAEDLRFGDVDYDLLTQAQAVRLFGKALSEERVKDDTGDWLLTLRREGLTLSYTLGTSDADAPADMLSVSGDLIGPRGLRTGMTEAETLALFYADGQGRTQGGISLLYGDGVSAPTGLMEKDKSGKTTLRYLALHGGDQNETVTLNLSFEDGVLKEWMIYSW